MSVATRGLDYTAAGLDGEGGGYSGEDGDDELNDFRPSFFFHCRKVLKGVAALKIEAKIKDIISAELRTTERPVINGRCAQNYSKNYNVIIMNVVQHLKIDFCFRSALPLIRATASLKNFEDEGRPKRLPIFV